MLGNHTPRAAVVRPGCFESPLASARMIRPSSVLLFSRRWPLAAVLALAAFPWLPGELRAQQGSAAAALGQQADALFDRHQYKEAAAAYESLLKGYPNSEYALDAQFHLAYTDFLLGQLDPAVDLLRKLQVQPNAAPDALEQAGLLLPQVLAQKAGALKADDPGRTAAYEAVIREYDSFIGKFPKSASLEAAFYGRALASYQIARYAAAARDLRQNVTNFPKRRHRAGQRVPAGHHDRHAGEPCPGQGPPDRRRHRRRAQGLPGGRARTGLHHRPAHGPFPGQRRAVPTGRNAAGPCRRRAGGRAGRPLPARPGGLPGRRAEGADDRRAAGARAGRGGRAPDRTAQGGRRRPRARPAARRHPPARAGQAGGAPEKGRSRADRAHQVRRGVLQPAQVRRNARADGSAAALGQEARGTRSWR